ncbi:MAG: hypothetical protein IJV30_07550 [Oscillospiraceae bacterium]|nr:hypothetical protein [Oscillospiraceae bacterium]
MKREVVVLTICFFLIFAVSFLPTSAEAEPQEAWKDAYLAMIHLENGKALNEGEERLTTYCLYDVDKDGIPELFLRYGISTATSFYDVYTTKDGNTVCLGRIFSGSAALYSYQEKNGVLLVYSHMRHAKAEKWMIENNALKTEAFYEEFIPIEKGVWYRPVQDYSPGSVVVTEFPAYLDYPVKSYEKWAFEIKNNTEYRFPNDDPSFYETVTNSNSPVKKVVTSRSAFILSEKKVSMIGFKDLLSQLIVSTPEEPKSYGEFRAYLADVNQDGKLEYILSHRRKDGPFSTNTFLIILSEQAGTIYAYVDEYSAITNVDSAGVMYSYSDEYGYIGENAFRLFFDGDECFPLNVSIDEYGGARGNNAP